jgi:hypothetical protein
MSSGYKKRQTVSLRVFLKAQPVEIERKINSPRIDDPERQLVVRSACH